MSAGIAGLQAAVQAPEKVKGVQLLDVSLRMLHTKKQQPWQRPLVSSFQRLLRETQLGQWFFSAVAKPQVLLSTTAFMKESGHKGRKETSLCAACLLYRYKCGVCRM